MVIETKNNHLAKPESNNDSNFIYHKENNEAILNLKTRPDTNKNDNELESEINLKIKNKVILAKYINYCLIKSNLYF